MAMVAPLLHPTTQRQLQAILAQDQGSYLLAGPASTGKYTAALWLAEQLKCPAADLIVVRPEEKPSIGIEQVQQLQHQLQLSISRPGVTRVVIIDQADSLTPEAQNALLKTVEEPPRHTLILLIVVNNEAILPTVRSRCQLINFSPLPEDQVAQYLRQQRLDPAAARHSQGAVGRAWALASDAAGLELLAKQQELARKVLGASLYERLRLAAELATSPQLGHFLSLLGRELQSALRRAAATADVVVLARVQRQLDVLLATQRRLEANVNPRLAVEGLMLEL